MAPPAQGGGRAGSKANLRFKPKSSVRRSQAERDADDKSEQAKIKAEEASAERDRQRAARRAERGAARGRTRGGGGIMAAAAGLGHLTGSIGAGMTRVSAGPGYGGGGGEYGRSGPSGGGGGGGGSSGGGGSGGGGGGQRGQGASGTHGVSFPTDAATGRRMVNIDEIALVNLVSSDEDGADGGDESKPKVKGKQRAKTSSHSAGLAPVRVARHEHIPRRMKVNIDLTTVPDEDRAEAKKVAAGDLGAVTDLDHAAQIKIEDEESAMPGMVAKQEPDALDAISQAQRAKNFRQKSLKGTAAAPTTIDLDDKPTDPASELPSNSTALIEHSCTSLPAPRPLFVPEDENFIAMPRPSGWESTEDVANWERNTHRAYLVYRELSNRDKMLRSGSNTTASAASKPAEADVDMKDANATDASTAATPSEKASTTHRDDLSYIFQIPPGIPGLEGLRSEASLAREREELQLLESAPAGTNPAPPSPSTSRKDKSKPKPKPKPPPPRIKPDPEIKQEDPHPSDDLQHPLRDPLAKADGTAPTSSAATGNAALQDQQPGYIGDLVVYNTGEAKLNWGGLPLRIRLGSQTTMLQNVLLTGAGVTRDAALRAEEAAAAARDEGAKVKKEGAKDKEKEGKEGLKDGSVKEQEGQKDVVDLDKNLDKDLDLDEAAMDNDRAFCMGHVAGHFSAVPDFNEFFGDKWRYVC